MEKFSPGVARELGHYVYRLEDPKNGKVFYVGKGQGDRIFAHIRAEEGYDGTAFGPDEKLETIRAIRNSGNEVIHVVHRHGLTEKCAWEVEAALIDAYPHLVNKAKGFDSRRRAQHIDEIERRYAKPMSLDPNHKLLFIKTTDKTVRLHGGGVYEAVRRSWIIDRNKAKRANYILAVIDGVCVGIFKSCKWKLSSGEEEKPKRKQRSEFTGTEVHEGSVYKSYYNKIVPADIRALGAANPIRYKGPF